MQLKILDTVKRFPGGLMVIPLLTGAVLNTFVPQALDIGSFTTGLARGSAALIGMFLFCAGASINFKSAKSPIIKGSILLVLKFGIGFMIGLAINKIFGPAGLLGITPLAAIAALTNSNGTIYSTMAADYGDSTDVGAVSILALNDGPFFTLIALGAGGMADIPVMSTVASVIPLLLGFVLGNLDNDIRKFLAYGVIMIPPFNGFALGCGMDLRDVLSAGIPGILLGVITVVSTGLLVFIIYSFIQRKPSPLGAAVGTTAGNAVATPAAVGMADASLQPYVATATAQVAASVVVTAILCPLVTAFCNRLSKKMIRKKDSPEKIPKNDASLETQCEEVIEDN